MLKLRWILFLLAVLTVATAWRVWSLSERRTGASLLASVEERLDTERPDYDAVLRELSLGLRFARTDADAATVRSLLLVRARVHLARTTYELALSDCRELLATSTAVEDEALYLAAEASRGTGELQLALGFTHRLLAADLEYPDGNRLLGRLELAIVDDRLEEVRRLLDRSLPTETALEGMEFARRASALPLENPTRLHALDSLQALVPEDLDSARIQELVEEASAHLIGARAAYVEELGLVSSPEAIEGAQDVLVRAGRHQAASTLGLVALRRHLQPSYTAVLVRTALSLVRIEKPSVAKGLIRSSIKRFSTLQSNYRSLEPLLLLEWCTLLHELELWPELNRAATGLHNRQHEFRGLVDLGDVPQFFLGVSRKGMGNASGALASLSKVGRMERRPDIFPGERMLSVLARADIFRLFGRRDKEHEILREVIRLPAPPRDDGPAARAYGEVRLRLAHQDEEGRRWAAAIHSYAEALRYLPRRRAEIEPLWLQAGENFLARGKHTIEGIARNLEDMGRQLPAGDVDLHRMVMLGFHHLEGRHAHTAHIAAARALEKYDGFPLALELDAAALQRLGRHLEAIDRFLALAEDGGGGPDLLLVLREISAAHFTPAQRLRWYRVDPRGAALRDVARRLMGEGDVGLALAAIRPQGGGDLEVHDRVLAAGLLGDLGRWEECRRALARIPPDDPGFAEAAGLTLLAGLRDRSASKGADTLVEAFGRIYAAPQLSAAGFDAAIDGLLAAGLREEVRLLLTHLDANLALHPPGLLLRAAISEVIAGRRDSAAEALDRAEAYYAEGEAQLGRVLLAVDAGDPDGLRTEARLLLDEGFARGAPHRESLLRILTGEHGVAHRLAVEAYTRSEGKEARRFLARIVCEVLHPAPAPIDEAGGDAPDGPIAADPSWLSIATFGGSAPSEEVAAILLALEGGPWSAWALTRLRELPSTATAGTWPAFLEASALVELGDEEEAEALLNQLTQSPQNFRFAWDLREEIARAKFGTEPDATALRELRRARAKALGPADFEAAEVRILWAAERQQAGRLGEAVQVLADGVAERPDHLDLGIALARTRREAGDFPGTLAEFDRIFERFPPTETAPLVSEVLTFMRHAAATGELTETAWWARLEALAARRPRDPALALELARRTAETASERADGGIGRAQELMERFRARTEYAPIDSLRRGEAARWVAFLAEYDPEAALALADAELLADPPAIDLWRAHAAALAAVGRYRDAIDDLRTLLMMVTDENAQLQIAGLLAELGSGPEVVLRILQRLGEDTRPDRTLERGFILGRALLNGTARQRSLGISNLTRAWNKLPPGTLPATKERIGRELAEALLLRNGRGDASTANIVLEDLSEETVDPLRSDYYRALYNLSLPR